MIDRVVAFLERVAVSARRARAARAARRGAAVAVLATRAAGVDAHGGARASST